MSDLALRPYIASGEVLSTFLMSQARIRAIMGPFGSGKTGACLMNMLFVAQRQAPHPRDGVRRTKFAVVRRSFRELEKTTIPSWLSWVPKTLGHFTGGSGGAPAVHTLRFALRDGTTVEMIVEFIGLGENKVEDVIPGWEGTGCYLNEADKLERDVLTWLNGRIGRYPARDNAAGFAGCTWQGIWLDFNAPDTEHWLYRDFVEEPTAGWEFFEQPGGLVERGSAFVANPAAENLANLPANYYTEQMAGQPKWFVRRMLCNRWGANREGEPVYEEFDDLRHMAAQELRPIRGLPLVIGADGALHPAAVITQRNAFGQILVLDEISAPDAGMGAQRFGEWLNAVLAARYPGFECTGYGDPSSGARAATDERTWLAVMRAVTGFPWRPAASNAIGLRLESVRAPLNRSIVIDGSPEPGLIVSPRCRKLRKGFNSSYHIKRFKDGEGHVADAPNKNHPYSDLHDGLQYACLGHGEHVEVLRRGQRAGGARQIEAITDDSPHGAYAGGRPAFAETE